MLQVCCPQQLTWTRRAQPQVLQWDWQLLTVGPTIVRRQGWPSDPLVQQPHQKHQIQAVVSHKQVVCMRAVCNW